jgi:hypothetical protein
VLGEKFTHDIHIPKETAVISLIHSTIPYIYVDKSLIHSNVFRHERLIVAGCRSHYNEVILANNKIKFLNKIQHIIRTNSEQIYLHFGSIPKRILFHNTEEEKENPIILALHLASNYPRRMAEFMA